MPISAGELLKTVGLEYASYRALEDPIEDESADKSGIYIITFPPNKNAPYKMNDYIHEPFVKEWVNRVMINEFSTNPIKNGGFDSNKIKNELSTYWLPKEEILYIGRAVKEGKKGSSIKKRVRNLFLHEIGNRGPHRGGQWLKTIKNWQQLYVYWAPTRDAIKLEKELINNFRDNSAKSLPPFANIEYWVWINDEWNRRRKTEES